MADTAVGSSITGGTIMQRKDGSQYVAPVTSGTYMASGPGAGLTSQQQTDIAKAEAAIKKIETSGTEQQKRDLYKSRDYYYQASMARQDDINRINAARQQTEIQQRNYSELNYTPANRTTNNTTGFINRQTEIQQRNEDNIPNPRIAIEQRLKELELKRAERKKSGNFDFLGIDTLETGALAFGGKLINLVEPVIKPVTAIKGTAYFMGMNPAEYPGLIKKQASQFWTDTKANPAYGVASLAGGATNLYLSTVGYSVAKQGLNIAGNKVISKVTPSRYKQYTPTPLMESLAEETSRQSSRIYLKDKSGNYILGKTGDVGAISFGGDVKSWETPKQAAIRELGEEIGIDLDTNAGKQQIKNFKFVKKIVYPEETRNIFTGEIDDIKSITPKSDVKRGLKIVNPKASLGFTGATARNPTKKGGVRFYELAEINYLETGQKPTWLYVPTQFKKGLNKPKKVSDFIERKGSIFAIERVEKFSWGRPGTYIDRLKGRRPGTIKAYADVGFLGIKSRYDIPYKVQKKYLEQEASQIFMSGTPSRSIEQIELGPLNIKKRIKVSKGASVRGEKPGLYISPPTSSKKGAPGYVAVKYLGPSNNKIRIPKISLIKDNGGDKAIYFFNEPITKNIGPTPKTFRGSESELVYEVGTVLEPTGKGVKTRLRNEKVIIQPARSVIDTGKTSPIRKSFGGDSETEYLEPPTQNPVLISNVKYKSSEYNKREQKGEGVKFLEAPKESFKIIEPKSPPSLKYSEPTKQFRIYEGPKPPLRIKEPPKTLRYSEGPFIPTKRKEPPIKLITRGPPPYKYTEKPYFIKKNYFDTGIKNAFEVQVRRKGKFITIGENLPFNVAVKKGVQTADTTISRTFRINPKGYTTQQDINYNLPKYFKVPKSRQLRGPNTFVEQPKTALSQFGEQRTIKAARGRGWF